MVSTYTPNIQLEEPARGDYVGTWDTPVNANMTLIDLVVGGRTTVSGAAGSVVLAAAQYQCKTITFNSTLLASIAITFPTSFTKSYEIYNTCTGSSAFVITLQTTAAGGQAVCCPPGEFAEIINDGTNIRFKNFGRIGSFWDYAGSSVPAWVSGCTVPPYLNCDATTFSSATYPQLTVILGSTTLPDIRGTTRATLNQGTGRITTAGGGIDGNTNYSIGGVDAVTLSTSQIPSHTHVNTLTDPGHAHTAIHVSNGTGGAADVTVGAGSHSVNDLTLAAMTGVTITNAAAGGGLSHPNMQPTTISGLCLIRAG